jgi:hypothetical protein
MLLISKPVLQTSVRSCAPGALVIRVFAAVRRQIYLDLTPAALKVIGRNLAAMRFN